MAPQKLPPGRHSRLPRNYRHALWQAAGGRGAMPSWIWIPGGPARLRRRWRAAAGGPLRGGPTASSPVPPHRKHTLPLTTQTSCHKSCHQPQHTSHSIASSPVPPPQEPYLTSPMSHHQFGQQPQHMRCLILHHVFSFVSTCCRHITSEATPWTWPKMQLSYLSPSQLHTKQFRPVVRPLLDPRKNPEVATRNSDGQIPRAADVPCEQSVVSFRLSFCPPVHRQMTPLCTSAPSVFFLTR